MPQLSRHRAQAVIGVGVGRVLEQGLVKVTPRRFELAFLLANNAEVVKRARCLDAEFHGAPIGRPSFCVLAQGHVALAQERVHPPFVRVVCEGVLVLGNGFARTVLQVIDPPQIGPGLQEGRHQAHGFLVLSGGLWVKALLLIEIAEIVVHRPKVGPERERLLIAVLCC